VSDLVSRLAARRDDIPGGFAASKYMNYEAAREAEARWWLLAIAEQLERRPWSTEIGPYGDGWLDGWEHASHWLRSEAGDAAREED
jgi:hypothetical protein